MDTGDSIPSADRVDLSYAELHTPLFLGSKNHGMKLGDLHGKQRLIYDRAEKELLVFFGEFEAIVPLTNVACMWPRKVAAPIPIAKKAQEPGLNPAQVETPQSHVFAGPGKGKR